MGVRGIWNHIQRHLEPVDVDTLRGKRLAIDVSIWLYESLKGCSAHSIRVEKPYLCTLLRRCFALIESGIQPIVVLDGFNYPAAKRRLSPSHSMMAEEQQQVLWSPSGLSQTLSPKRTPIPMQKRKNGRPNSTCANSTMKIACETIKELMSAIGVPVIQSPGEAEAQCAHMEMHSLTDGCITDDIDYLLFGGATLFRVDFSATRPLFLRLSIEKLQQEHGLNRNSLVALAILMGCDYYAGIPRIGFVTGLEVVAEFSDDANDDHPETILERFRVYCSKELLERSSDTNRKKRLRNFNFDFPKSDGRQPTFPDSEIINLFLKPDVDATISKDRLNRLCHRTGYDQVKTKKIMTAECRWSERKVQEFFAHADRRLAKNKRENQQEGEQLTDHYPVVKRTGSKRDSGQLSKREWNAAALLKEKARRYNPVLVHTPSPAKRPKKRRLSKSPVTAVARSCQDQTIELVDLVSSASRSKDLH